MRIRHFKSMRIRIQIQGLDDQNWEKFTAEKKHLYFFDEKIAI